MELYNFELKEKLSDKFLKTVSSFANYNDGIIVFGVSNEGKSIGLENLDEAKLTIENKINDSIKPRPEFDMQIDFEENTITLTVYEGESKPYYYKGKAYKRSDSSDVEVDRNELNNLILKGRNQDYEELRAPDQNLSFNYFYKEAKVRMGIDSPDLDLLRSFDLYSEKQGYNNAAYLLADENFYNIIDFVKFGDSISKIEFNEFFTGISILQAFNRMMELFDQYYTYQLVEGKSRNSYEKIPRASFREALANAIVHRRWDVNEYISISFHNDRIEITSPGGLPNNMSFDIYLTRRVSSPRNPMISTVFQRFNYIEKLGTGIFRINEEYKNSKSKPVFDIGDDFITIVLPVLVDKQEIEFTKDLRILHQAMDDNQPLSRRELEKITGFEKTKVIRLINQLRDHDLVEVVGNGRSTKYKLLDD